MAQEAAIYPAGPPPADELQYREFWESNLQKMEEISSRIEKTLVRLEKKYVDFDESYEELISSINLLLSIYGSYNNLQGIDYLLKLKACLGEYRKRYSHEGIRFNVLYYLHAKVMELRGGSFDRFPRMQHNATVETAPPVGRTDFEPTHKWITFSRYDAWFITPYDDVVIIPRNSALLTFEGLDGHEHLTHGGVDFLIIDSIIPRECDRGEPPELYIIASGSCYAASSAGKRILAGRDIMRGKLKSYPHARGKFIRLFGKNHIWLGG